MAAADPAERQRQAGGGAVAIERFERVGRAGRLEAAGAAEPGAERRSDTRAPAPISAVCGQDLMADAQRDRGAEQRRPARRARRRRSARDAALANSAPVERRAQANDPQAGRQPVAVALGRGVDLALDQRPGHGPACMPLRHDGADPGKGSAKGPWRTSLPQAMRLAGPRLLITSPPTGRFRAARRGEGCAARWCTAKCAVAARLRMARTRSKSAETTRRGSGGARRAARACDRRSPRRLRPPGACGPWRAGR